MEHQLIIKNMVCPRCIEAVLNILKEAGVTGIVDIQLGKVIIKEPLNSISKKIIEQKLNEKGFDLLDEKHALINQIKSIIIQEVHHEKEPSLVNLSALLARRLNYDYAYLSRLFYSIEEQTIEGFVLAHKIEKVKELLIYDELNLSEIAYRMNYSSPAHLSNQFKKITGITPSNFKKLHDRRRKSLDEI